MSSTNATPAAELRTVADDVSENGWHPQSRSLIDLLTLDGWDALVTHLNEELVVAWERVPGRTVEDVVRTLRAAADSAERGAGQ